MSPLTTAECQVNGKNFFTSLLKEASGLGKLGMKAKRVCPSCQRSILLAREDVKTLLAHRVWSQRRARAFMPTKGDNARTER
jgi:hypothetical protein